MSGPTRGASASVTVLLSLPRVPGGPIWFDLGSPRGGLAGMILAGDPEYPAAEIAIVSHVPCWTEEGLSTPKLEIPSERVKELILRFRPE